MNLKSELITQEHMWKRKQSLSDGVQSVKSLRVTFTGHTSHDLALLNTVDWPRQRPITCERLMPMSGYRLRLDVRLLIIRNVFAQTFIHTMDCCNSQSLTSGSGVQNLYNRNSATAPSAADAVTA